MKKTIAFFLSDLQNGGTEWFALHLARGLKKNGYQAVFLLSSEAGDLLPHVQKEFRIVNLKGSGYCPLGVMRTIPALIRYLKAEEPEILISGLPLINAAAGIGVFLSGSSTRLIVVDHIRLCPTRPATYSIKNWLKAKMVIATHCMADHHICVSQTVARDLQCYTKKKAHPRVIYNPVIPDNFDELCKESANHPWINSPNQPLLISIGRLLAHKDYPTLLLAFHEVVKESPKARLIILGEGEDRKKLEKMIKKLGLEQNVSLPGAVTNIFPYLQSASLFVLPSQSEAFGNVIVEALACGIPVVSTDCGGPREILQDGKYGILVPVGDSRQLAIAIKRSLDTPQDKDALKKRGLSFSVSQATESYLKLIGS